MNALNIAILGTLTSGTALGTLLTHGTTAGSNYIYFQQAPDNTARPYVVWSQQAGGDDVTLPARGLNYLEYIRGYADNAAQAGSIAEAVDGLLHGKTLSVTGYTNFWCNRELEISLISNEQDGEKVYSEGGLYRVRLDK